MDNITEYSHYWETNAFLRYEEFDLGCLEEPLSGGNYSCYDSSSPEAEAEADGTHDDSPASKNIVSERNRRKKLNDRLYALRAVVPNITKMDKASIIKDAIEYIKALHEEQSRMQAEIMELENGVQVSNNGGGLFEYDQEVTTMFNNSQHQPKRTRLMGDYYGNYNYSDYSVGSTPASFLPFSPIEVSELRVTNMGEKILVVSLTCSKRTDTMVKLCEIFESLNLKIITANITAFSGRLLKTVFIEGDEEEKEVLKLKIMNAIAALNYPDSPMSS